MCHSCLEHTFLKGYFFVSFIHLLGTQPDSGSAIVQDDSSWMNFMHITQHCSTCPSSLFCLCPVEHWVSRSSIGPGIKGMDENKWTKIQEWINGYLFSPRDEIPEADCWLIPKKELGVLKQRGLGHFITHMLLGSNRLEYNGGPLCNLQAEGIHRMIACPLHRWISSDVLWEHSFTLQPRSLCFDPHLKIGNKGSGQFPLLSHSLESFFLTARSNKLSQALTSVYLNTIPSLL